MKAQRMCYMDSIRLWMILAVLVTHFASPYCTIIPWWPVLDSVRGSEYDIAIILCDCLQLPVLFFLAGYFAPRSLDKHGASQFMRGKFLRLIVPMLVLGFFYAPIIPYIGHLVRTGSAMPISEFITLQLVTAVVPLPIQPDSWGFSQKFAWHFRLWHLWYLSVLFFFFAVYSIWASRRSVSVRPESPTRSSVFRVFGLTIVVSTVAMSLVNSFVSDVYWLNWGGYLLIQPTRIPLYFCMFVAGTYAGRRQWFAETASVVRCLGWGVASGGIFILLMKSIPLFVAAGGGALPAPLALLNGGLRSCLGITSLLFCLSVGQRFGRNPSTFTRSLSRSSFAVYLLHMPFGIFMAYLLLPLPIPAFGKFSIVFVVTLFLCWFVSPARRQYNQAVLERA